jgi:hypothetical protein
MSGFLPWRAPPPGLWEHFSAVQGHVRGADLGDVFCADHQGVASRVHLRQTGDGVFKAALSVARAGFLELPTAADDWLARCRLSRMCHPAQSLGHGAGAWACNGSQSSMRASFLPTPSLHPRIQEYDNMVQELHCILCDDDEITI